MISIRFQSVSFEIKWKCQSVLIATLKLLQWLNFELNLITLCHSLSYLITACSPGWQKKIISFDNFKISSHVADFLSHFIAPCRSLSYLIAPYRLHWRKKHFHLATWRLVPRPEIFYHIWSCVVTRYHTLSHVIIP